MIVGNGRETGGERDAVAAGDRRHDVSSRRESPAHVESHRAHQLGRSAASNTERRAGSGGRDVAHVAGEAHPPLDRVGHEPGRQLQPDAHFSGRQRMRPDVDANGALDRRVGLRVCHGVVERHGDRRGAGDRVTTLTLDRVGVAIDDRRRYDASHAADVEHDRNRGIAASGRLGYAEHSRRKHRACPGRLQPPRLRGLRQLHDHRIDAYAIGRDRERVGPRGASRRLSFRDHAQACDRTIATIEDPDDDRDIFPQRPDFARCGRLDHQAARGDQRIVHASTGDRYRTGKVTGPRVQHPGLVTDSPCASFVGAHRRRRAIARDPARLTLCRLAQALEQSRHAGQRRNRAPRRSEVERLARVSDCRRERVQRRMLPRRLHQRIESRPRRVDAVEQPGLQLGIGRGPWGARCLAYQLVEAGPFLLQRPHRLRLVLRPRLGGNLVVGSAEDGIVLADIHAQRRLVLVPEEGAAVELRHSPGPIPGRSGPWKPDRIARRIVCLAGKDPRDLMMAVPVGRRPAEHRDDHVRSELAYHGDDVVQDRVARPLGQRLLGVLGEAEVVGTGEILPPPVEAARREEFLRPDRA